MLLQTIDNAKFGARISNFDCASLDADAIDAIQLALQQHQLLVFPDQLQLTPQQEVAFYRAINPGGKGVWRDQKNNPWEVYKVEQGNMAGTYQLPDEPGVLVLGKGEINHYGLEVTLGGARAAYGVDRGSQVLGGGALQWHIDGCFYQYAPCHYTQMRCIESPAGSGHWLAYDGNKLWCEAGATAFASGRIAWDSLSADNQTSCLNMRVHYASHPFQVSYTLPNSDNGLRLVDAEAESDYRQGRDVCGSKSDDPLAQSYPLVWTCPVTGLQALMPQPRCMQALQQIDESGKRYLGVVESRFMVESWMRPAIAPQQVYVHAWQPGDLVIWNNRSMWHSATGKLSRDDRRIMHLTAFNGDDPPRCITAAD